MSQPTVAGRPTWIDLATHDIDAAERFYSEQFGWNFLDQGPDFGGYRMVQCDGGFVAGAMSSLMGPDGPTETPQMPTCWTVYLHVADIDSALEKVGAAGGQVMMPAMAVGAAGKMALVTDPAGAVVGMWQPHDFEGFDFTGKPGTPVWFEVMSTDYDAAVEFYRTVFGWDVQPMGDDSGEMRYATNGAGESAAAGICDASSFLGDGPSFWRMYLLVPGTDAAVEEINAKGGELVDGPVDSPFGRLATVKDPQGAMFQVIEPAQR